MLAAAFLPIFLRDIAKLQEELKLYPDEATVWDLKRDVKNSAGTLALHIAGNLKHFIGATLGDTGYVRKRDREFSDRNISREQLIKGLDEALGVVKATLSALPDEKIMSAYPLDGFGIGKGESTLFVLAALIAHLSYHLGQVNYHRRLIRP